MYKLTNTLYQAVHMPLVEKWILYVNITVVAHHTYVTVSKFCCVIFASKKIMIISFYI